MNAAYTAFDTELYQGRRAEDYRSPFQIDRDRIVYLPAFRRLQAKTQVFLPGEYDFYRTRLTHSLEVAQIGRSIAAFLTARDPTCASSGFSPDADLIEAICLAHDLGHPPFGHIGERELNALLADWGGYEGNAQTLRLLTERAYEREDEDRGMTPTRALLDGVMKYKRLRSECPETEREHHFLYDEQEPIRTFVRGGAPALGSGLTREPRSIECLIMDWADDTAYSLHDIVDGNRAGFLTLESLGRWSGSESLGADESDWFDELRTAIQAGDVEVAFAKKVGRFVRACSLAPRSGFLSRETRRHAYTLRIDPEVERECALYKRIAVDLIFKSHRIQEIEFKGRFILRRLFEAFAEAANRHSGSAPLAILPLGVLRRLERADGERARMRVIADHLSSMTDGHALRTYKRLFDPDFRSITEIT